MPSAAIAFTVIWNVLFFTDQLGYFGKKSNMPVGNGARIAIAFAFLFALAILIAKPLQKVVLKEGRTIQDVKLFLLFLMFITGILFMALTFMPN